MRLRVVSLGAVATLFAVEVMAQCTTGQVTNDGITETGRVSFSALSSPSNRSVSVGGLTLTCANRTASEVASFFSNLSAGSGGPSAPPGCSKGGSLAGWSSGPVQTGQSVVFTSTTSNANVSDLVVTGTFAGITRTDGAAPALASLFTGSLVCARPATGYTGKAADRWQEQHRTNGDLFDFKLGVGDPMDPQKKVGVYSFSGTGTSSVVNHTYGSTTYSWRVFLRAAPNVYSFCNAAGTEVVRATILAGQGVSGIGCTSYP